MTESEPRVRVLELKRSVVGRNDELAAALRARYAAAGLFALNLLSGPGAGKTSLLERSLQRLQGRLASLVIEGDLRTDRDAERIAAAGGRAIQIVTNGTCHLDARMVETALGETDLTELELLVIENVGNLVCPGSFDLGESARAVVASVPEGDDKPEKYPFIFEGARAIILNKIDLLPHVPFGREAFWMRIGRINPSAERFEVSCTRGDGVEEWVGWLEKEARGIRAADRSAQRRDRA